MLIEPWLVVGGCVCQLDIKENGGGGSGGQMSDAFSNSRLLRSARPRISSPVLRSDGTMASDNSAKLCRWKECLIVGQHLHPVSYPVQLQMHFLTHPLTALHLQKMK